MNNKISLSLIAGLLILCIYLSQQALYWRDTAELRSETADAWCDKYEEEVESKVKPVPQWVLDDFDSLGSCTLYTYSIHTTSYIQAEDIFSVHFVGTNHWDAFRRKLEEGETE